MNKKYLSFIIALLLVFSLAGCIEPVTEPDYTKPLAEKDSGLTIANPVKEMSREELLEKTGIDLGPAEGAENLVYSMIDLRDAYPIAQLKCSLDGHELCLRAQEMTAQAAAGDISGMYYEWESTRNVFVSMRYAVVSLAGDIGCIKWIDAENGLHYSLSMNQGADEKLLIELAEKLFYPTGS